MRIVDLFAGPGGADLGIREALPDAEIVGVEWDQAACDTRRAAGLETVQADVSQLDPAGFAPVDGMWASPPCQDFSMAGRRAGIDGERGMLIHEVMRWARALEPSWVACEQVPPALPVWELFAAELRGMGYRTWAGILNAADYGVPQTRRRAILMASRDLFGPPEPTHAQHPEPQGLFGGARLPWVTMADALGWSGEFEYVPNGEAVDTRRMNQPREGTLPAPTITGISPNAARWRLHTNRGQDDDGSRQTVDPHDQPAPSVTGKSGGQWVLRNNSQANAAKRRLNEPAPTMFFGPRANEVAWVHERPATTIVGSFSPDVVAAPGYRTETSRQDAEGSVRVTVEQAAALQGFPPDHPWQGSKTKRFEQVGNAVPPPLARAVVAAIVEDPR